MLLAAIPTMKPGRVNSLLEQISKCSVKPDVVYVMNNSLQAVSLPNRKNFLDIQFQKNIGVNPAWNCALKTAKLNRSNLSILNDDISIEEDFFRKALETLEKFPTCGVVCPNTNSGAGWAPPGSRGARFAGMGKKEGWAFTIRAELIEKLPPIPIELRIFFGDDWIWHFTYINGYSWVKDLSSKITHAVGASLRENPNIRKRLEYERNAYRALLGTDSAREEPI